MKMNIVRAVLVVGALVVAAVGVVVGFVKTHADPTFELPLTGISASDDAALVARGAYLFHGPMHCVGPPIRTKGSWTPGGAS